MTPAQQQPRRGATPTRGRTGVASTSVSRSSSPAFKVPALPGSSQGYGSPSIPQYTTTHAPGAWSGQAPASVTPAPAMPTGTAPLPGSGYVNTQSVPMTPATAAALQSRLQSLNTGGTAPLPGSGYVHPPTPGAAPLSGGPVGANTVPYAGIVPGVTMGTGMVKMDGEDDLDGGGDDEVMPAMADDDYSAQANWQTQSKDNLKYVVLSLIQSVRDFDESHQVAYGEFVGGAVSTVRGISTTCSAQAGRS
jgi:transcription initiation factor TFIID subunit 11